MEIFSPHQKPSSLILQAVQKILIQEKLFHQEASLVVGCSLGPDSTALTLALLDLQKQKNFQMHVVYIDHGLRPDSQAEGNLFLQWAINHQLSAEVAHIIVPKQGSLMDAARDARYQALVHIAQQRKAQAVLVGHTLTDQCETFLMRLLSGSRLQGLAGMKESRSFESHPNIHLVRPLLSIKREQILEFLQEKQEQFLEDPTNQNTKYFRSRIRHQLFPLLKKEQPHIEEQIGALAKQIQHDSDYLEAITKQQLISLQKEGLFQEQAPSHFSFSVPHLLTLHPTIFSRIFSVALPFPLSKKNLEYLASLCESDQGTKRIDLPAGFVAERSYQTLTIYPLAGSDSSPQPVEITGSGSYLFGPWQITVSLEKGIPQLLPKHKISMYSLSNQVAPPWILRSSLPGDYIKPRHSKGHRKISDILINAKVPRFQRPFVPILCQGNQILWVAGHCVAEQGHSPNPFDEQEFWLFTLSSMDYEVKADHYFSKHQESVQIAPLEGSSLAKIDHHL